MKMLIFFLIFLLLLWVTSSFANNVEDKEVQIYVILPGDTANAILEDRPLLSFHHLKKWNPHIKNWQDLKPYYGYEILVQEPVLAHIPDTKNPHIILKKHPIHVWGKYSQWKLVSQVRSINMSLGETQEAKADLIGIVGINYESRQFSLTRKMHLSFWGTFLKMQSYFSNEFEFGGRFTFKSNNFNQFSWLIYYDRMARIGAKENNIPQGTYQYNLWIGPEFENSMVLGSTNVFKMKSSLTYNLISRAHQIPNVSTERLSGLRLRLNPAFEIQESWSWGVFTEIDYLKSTQIMRTYIAGLQFGVLI